MIDGHAHACGPYLTADAIIEKLDKSEVSHVVLVPGELDSTTEYR